MFPSKRFPSWKLLSVVLVVFLSGCASAYHDYADCCVPYRYCQPRPLPYVAYQGCHCPTPAGSQYSDLQTGVLRAGSADPAVPAEASASARDDAAVLTASR
jgi:hypothetical protein